MSSPFSHRVGRWCEYKGGHCRKYLSVWVEGVVHGRGWGVCGGLPGRLEKVMELLAWKSEAEEGDGDSGGGGVLDMKLL